MPPAASGNRRVLLILFVTVFLDLVGFGIVIPLLPLYAENLGASPLTVTWLVAIYSLMQFFVAPAWGRLSDRHGRRPILVFGLFGSAISYVLFGISTTLTALFAARLVNGVMGANVGVAQAYVADVTSPEERARGMGMIGAAFGLGFIFGPLIGGILSPFGTAVPFFVAGGLALLNAILAIRWLPEPVRDRPVGQAQSGGLGARLRSLADLLRTRRSAGLYAAFFLLTFAFAGLEATLSLWADRRLQFEPSHVAYLFAWLGLVATLVQGGLIGPLIRTLGEKRVAWLGSFALLLGFLSLAYINGMWAAAAALGAIGFGQGTTTPTVTALISRAAPGTRQGELLGVSQSLSALARVVGPVAAGAMFSVRIALAYHLAAAAILLAMLALFSTRTPRRTPSEQPT